MKILGMQLEMKKWEGQRVVTFRDIDAVHQRPEGTARKTFNRNKKHFVLGEDYFALKPQTIENTALAKYEDAETIDFTELGISCPIEQTLNFTGVTSPRGTIFLTESGYLMLVKTFTDDLAWQVQKKLIKSYFRGQDYAKKYDELQIKYKDLQKQAQRYANIMQDQRGMIRELQDQIPKKPQSNYISWISRTFTRLKLIQDYLFEHTGELYTLKRTMKEIFKEIERQNEDVRVQDYVDQYLSEHPDQEHVYHINAMAEYKDGREIMDSVLNELFDRYNLSMTNIVTVFEKEAA